MKLIKKLFLIIFGILITLIISEIVLRFYQPENLKFNQINDEDKDFFSWAYLDIHTPFFKIDGDKFYIQRKDIFIPEEDNFRKYNYSKEKGIKRIFILGESTAKYYSKEILEQKLLKHFKCEVINCGMGAYDSYRIEKISKEIAKLEPDWVICFIGNNDEVIENQFFIGMSSTFTPIEINSLPYRYPFIKKLFTLNLLSNIFNREIKYTTQIELEIFFKKNVINIVKNLKNTKIIFVDLPNNKDFHNCEGLLDIIREDNEGPIYWKDSNHYKILLERLKFIKSLKKEYSNVFVTNLTDTLSDYCNNNLSYNIFKDECHWTKATYELLTEIICKIIIKQEFDKDINIETEISKENFNKSLINNMDFYNSYGAIDYLVKTSFDHAYNIYISKKEMFKEDLFDEAVYDNICFYAYCLYKNNHKALGLNILKELISLQPELTEAALMLGYIYYKQNDIEKAKEYFDIVKKLEPDNEINVEYLKSLKR